MVETVVVPLAVPVKLEERTTGTAVPVVEALAGSVVLRVTGGAWLPLPLALPLLLAVAVPV